MNQEQSEQDEVDGTKKEADSTPDIPSPCMRRRPPVTLGDTLFDVPWRSLTNNDLGETRYKKVVGQSLDAAGRQLGPLATQRASELPVVCVLLVGRLSRHVTLNTVFTERVEARQTLGTLVGLETDLTDKELFVDLLGQASAKRAGRRNHEDFVTERLPSC